MDDPLTLLLLLGWGMLAGLDLVSVPQAMIARPIVAGTVAGWIAGDVAAGMRIGALLELFALDVLPVGASRYPDYGPATVGAAAFLAAAPKWDEALGVALAIALPIGLLGGWTLQRLRHRIARSMQARSAQLAAGETAEVRALMRASVGRDALRALALTALALAVGFAANRLLVLDAATGWALTVTAVGSGLAAAAGGAIRTAGRGARLRWLAVGAVSGLLLTGLR